MKKMQPPRKAKRKNLAAEELETIRAYDSAKKSSETPIPYEQVLRRIKQSRG